MIGVWYAMLGSDMVGQGFILYVGVWYGAPDMVGHVPTQNAWKLKVSTLKDISTDDTKYHLKLL